MDHRGGCSHKPEDIGWENFVATDERKKKIQCKWCNRIISGGFIEEMNTWPV
jgi:hypothetical protein